MQFASLDEQLFKAMQSLFSQDQRECVARLAGMKAPVSLRTFAMTPAAHPTREWIGLWRRARHGGRSC